MTSETPRNDKLTITGNFHGNEISIPVTIIEEWGRHICLIDGKPVDAALIAKFDCILRRFLLDEMGPLPVVVAPDIEHPFQGIRTFLG